MEKGEGIDKERGGRERVRGTEEGGESEWTEKEKESGKRDKVGRRN